ncbi:hypothetical protein, partial [Morganella morganii]|uniref:hypothetical protein n=1 Tax=Morganella morganii TaxID=582 RepID=UPI001C8BDB31
RSASKFSKQPDNLGHCCPFFTTNSMPTITASLPEVIPQSNEPIPLPMLLLKQDIYLTIAII